MLLDARVPSSEPARALAPQIRRLSPLVLLVPGVLGLIGVLRHEWWRDEAYTWLVVRSSGSVGELLENLDFNGHPWAYYVLAWGLHHLVASPLVLSLTNLGLSLAATALVLRSAPLSRLQALLFALGFYPLYQYGVIARSYSLFLFLLCAYCHLRATRPKAVTLRLVVLAVLAQVHLISIVAAWVLLLLEWVESRRSARWTGRDWAAAALVVGSIAFALWQVAPRGGRGGSFGVTEAALILRGLANGFLPDFGVLRDSATQVVFGVGMWIGSFILLRARRDVLVPYALLSGSLLAICAVVYPGYRWHHGFYFVYLLVALWLAADAPIGGLAARALTLALGLHVAIGAYALGTDLAGPYSDGKMLVDELREQGLEGLPLVGMKVSRGDGQELRYKWEIDDIQPVLLHLPDGRVFDPIAGTFEPFARRPQHDEHLYKRYAHKYYFARMDREAMGRALGDVAARLGGRFLVIVSRGPGPEAIQVPEPLRKLKDFPPVADYGERYSLYLHPQARSDLERPAKFFVGRSRRAAREDCQSMTLRGIAPVDAGGIDCYTRDRCRASACAASTTHSRPGPDSDNANACWRACGMSVPVTRSLLATHNHVADAWRNWPALRGSLRRLLL